MWGETVRKWVRARVDVDLNLDGRTVAVGVTVKGSVRLRGRRARTIGRCAIVGKGEPSP